MKARAAAQSQVDRPRQVAYEVLRAVTEKGAYANLLLPERLRAAGLSGRDAAFATELTYGTLRRSGSYDVIAASVIDRPWADVDRPIQDLLRLGAHQLLGMNVPTHAAVTTTVDLAKSEIGPGRAGFVNAVLRRVSASTYDEWVTQLAGSDDPMLPETLALRHAHPEWLVEAFSQALVARGRPAEEIAELLAADNVAPEVTLVARPGRCTQAELIDAGARPGRWSPMAAIWPAGDPGSLPSVKTHRAGVQDEGSQLVTAALVAAPLAVSSGAERWLDMCAGPGGKAALLAALAEQRGASLQAWELLPHRARLVKQAVGAGVEVRVVDAGDPATRLRGGRWLRPGAARRPLLRCWSAAPASGGAVAQATG